MSRNYSFRKARTEDLPLILEWTEALMAHESLDKNIEIPLTENIHEQLKDWLKNLVVDDNALIIIATDDVDDSAKGIIIGYLQPRPNNFTIFEIYGVIQLVWVEKNHRNHGLATQLVNHMEDTFSNLKIPYCEIQYSDSNSEAKGFWKKAGYTIVSHNCRKMFN